MRKLVLLVALGLGISTFASAQEYTFQHDSVTHYTVGLPASTPADESPTIHNTLANSTSSVLSGLKWQIVSAPDSSAVPYKGWYVYSFCDNILCYTAGALAVQNTNPLQYEEFVFGDIAVGANSDFKLQVYVPESTPDGTIGIVKVRAWNDLQDDTATFVIIKVGALSIKNVSANENKVTVYPNPSTNELNIAIDKELSVAQVSVIDLSGKKVLASNVDANKVSLNAQQLSKGQYIIVFTDLKGNPVATKKWIKQ